MTFKILLKIILKISLFNEKDNENIYRDLKIISKQNIENKIIIDKLLHIFKLIKIKKLTSLKILMKIFDII